MRRNLANCLFLAALAVFFLAVPLGVLLWAQRETTAYYENRVLAERPAVTGETLWDGSFGTAWESWFSDHFPGRTTLLKTDTRIQMHLLHRPVVNGIVVKKDVLLPEKEYGEQSRAEYEQQAVPVAARFEKLNQAVTAYGGTFLYVGLPEQRVYFADRYPADLDNHQAEMELADGIFADALEQRGVPFLNLRAVYEELGHPDEFYSTVDHHYRYQGAYAAYRSILERLGELGRTLPVLTEEDLDVQTVPNPYIGSRNRKLYNLWPTAERAEIGVQKNPVPYERWDNGTRTDRPLFVLPEQDYLPTTYGLYMGGDFGETILRTNRPELPNALIIGDSFTNALETLLYASFNETRSLDLRQYQEQSVQDYLKSYQPDVVLFVENDTFYYMTTGNNAVWAD